MTDEFETYIYEGPRKDMNLNSIEERLEDVVPYGPNNIRSYLEWLWPENEDGSRRVDDHTIMTAEAWIKMLEDAKHKVAISVPKVPVYPPWYHQMLATLSMVEERESLAASQRRGHPMYFVGGRRNGRTQMYSTMDEWLGTQPRRINVKLLNDPEYLEVLKEQILEQVQEAR